MKNSSRILFFSPDTGSPNLDGTVTNAINVAKSFADSSLPGIFIYNGRQDVFDRFAATGVDVRRIDFPTGNWKNHLNPFSRREYARKLSGVIEKEQIDIVHLFPRAAYVTSYLSGIDVFKVAQQPYASPDLKPFKLFENGFSVRPRKLLNAWYRKYVKFNYSKADLVSGISQAQQVASINIFGVPESKTAIVHPGVAPQISQSNPGALRAELGVPEGVKIVLSVGRITRSKGVEEFGEIARILNKRDRSYRFVFAGHGTDNNYEMKIRERYREYVTFIGHRDDISTCYADADIYLHPSHREGLGLAIIEAMEFGLPAITWRIPGCDELVTNGENGSLLQFGDVIGAADEVEKLLEDDYAYGIASVAASLRFKEKHDINEYAPRMMRIYQEALAKKSKK